MENIDSEAVILTSKFFRNNSSADMEVLFYLVLKLMFIPQ